MVTRSAPQKRKQAADAIESPPKRVTRARTAKPIAEADGPAKKTKAAVAPAKAAATKTKASAAGMKASARTSRKKATTEVEGKAAGEQTQDENMDVAEPTAATAKSTSTRQRKAASGVTTSKADDEAIQPKTRRARSTASKPEPAAASTRGRGRKAAEPTEDTQVEHDAPVEGAEAEPVPAKKPTTRGRAAASTKAKTTRTTAATRSTGSKKKVQFEDEVDKENIPIDVPESKKSTGKATGMKAKPVRKPAATRTTTRGRKAAKEESSDGVKEQKASMPLSPKKVDQVAKTPSVSDDELGTTQKSPVKALSRSPIKSPFKAPISPAKCQQSPAKSASNVDGTVAPAKHPAASILGSPAKRAPLSPFKDALKSPAKRFDVHDTVSKCLFTASQSASPMKTSLMQESPRKVKLPDSTQTILEAPQSSLKKSLLQSPARRPAVSPFKNMASSIRHAPAIPKAADNPSVEAEQDLVNPSRTPQDTPSAAKDQAAEPVATVVPEYDMMDVDEEHQDANGRAGESATESVASSPSVNLLNDGEVHVVQNGLQNNEIFGVQSASPKFTFYGPEISVSSMDYRQISNLSQLSEDELASPDKRFVPTSPKKQTTVPRPEHTPASGPPEASLTPLAERLNGWAASSPDKGRPSRQQRGIFSLAGSDALPQAIELQTEQPGQLPIKSSFFEDDLAVLNAQQPTPERPSDFLEASVEEDIGRSMESVASQEYGDENALPSEAEMLRMEQENNDPTLTCTPAKVFTPAKQTVQLPREAYTVSKVPLRPSAEDSPLKLPRQRSKSIGGALSVLVDNEANEHEPMERPVTPVLTATTVPETPSSGMKLDVQTPGRTGRKRGSSDVLKGAIVFVDVHTSEGADASSIFVDLLTQMGARCVKQWNWNPRASLGDSLDGKQLPSGASPSGTPAANKVGITHVVYKDGGVRTLEKVRMSKGVVSCVGVGWVLDCEREDKWLDESTYVIDTSLVPRGGQRRRKSMEPRALANLGGNIVPANSETPAKAGISPTKEFLTFNTPNSRRDTFTLDVQHVTPEEADQISKAAPATPLDALDDEALDFTVTGGMSPTTPYYLTKGAELVQQTCPPKQRGESLFPITGNVEDEPDDAVRRRLIAARRRTLQFSSKTKSPLGRTVSYGSEKR